MDLQRCLIVPFINIFVDVLHGFYSGADFDVNIYLKKMYQKRIIRDDPTIIKSIIRTPKNNLVIYYTSSSIYKIFVGINYNRLIKFARKIFYTSQKIVRILFNYIKKDRIQKIIKTINYRLFNNYNQRSIRIQLSIREFNANKIINILRFRKNVTSVNKDDNIHIK